jgi:hypothetical protein
LQYNFFYKEGFNVDIFKAKAICPELLNIKTWLRDESAYKK